MPAGSAQSGCNDQRDRTLVTDNSMTMSPATGFEVHGARGPFNAAFFSMMGPYIEWNLRQHKRRVFAGLPQTVVELGPGGGANLRYLHPGSTLVAIEPNVPMHRRLPAAAARHSVRLRRRAGLAWSTRPPPQNDAGWIYTPLA